MTTRWDTQSQTRPKYNIDYDSKVRQKVSGKTLDNTDYDNQVIQTILVKSLDNTDYDN